MAEEKKLQVKKRSALSEGITKFSSNCAMALRDSAGDLKQLFQAEKANMQKNIGMPLPVYDTALSLSYAALKMPDTMVKKACGPIFGTILGLFYNNIISHFEILVRLLDIRTYKAVIMSIIGVIKNCFPKVFTTLWNGLVDMLSKLFGVIKAYIKGEKYIAMIAKRQMLTEAKHQSLLRRMTNWVKEKAAKVAEYCKSTLGWILKRGWQGFSYIYLKFVYPIAQCVSENNKINFAFNSFKSKDGIAKYAQAIGGYLGFVGGAALTGAATASITSLILPMSGLFVAFTSITYAFTIFGWLNSAGNVIDMASMFTDVLDDMEII